MHLIFGGAYQGKLEYALSQLESGGLEAVYTFKNEDECATPVEALEMLNPAKNISKDCKIINHLERFSYACVNHEQNPIEYLKAHSELIKDRIIIAEDISQGIVPLDQTERAWREANGRMLAYLAGEATCVTRVFCGIAERIK